MFGSHPFIDYTQLDVLIKGSHNAHPSLPPNFIMYQLVCMSSKTINCDLIMMINIIFIYIINMGI